MTTQQEERCKKLFALGLKYDGENLLYKDINFHWTDVTCMTDQEFDKAYKGAVKRMAVLKKEGMESPDNIRYVCKDCANEKKVETQKNLPPLPDLVGKNIKKAFEEGNRTEHMWVKITSVNEEAGTLIGTLDNDPAVVSNVTCGDEIVVYAHEIEEII